MRYLINGVDGQLGRVAADEFLKLVDPNDVVLCSPVPERIPKEKMDEWKSKGAEFKVVSYDNYDQMVEAYTGVDRMLLISTWLIGETRRIQHRNAINAAKAAGVKHIVYTSFNGAEIEEDTPLVASDHRDTEQAILESGLSWNFQRNMLYYDNAIMMFYPLAVLKNNCEWRSNIHGKKCGYVLREDCSRVAAALLAGKGEDNKAYTITGPELFSEAELFAEIDKQTGYHIDYQDCTTEELYDYWMGKGVPKTVHGDYSNSIFPEGICADDLVGNNASLGSGHFEKLTNNVELLTGRKPVPVKEGLKKYINKLPRK